jgi:hypothetical protein
LALDLLGSHAGRDVKTKRADRAVPPFGHHCDALVISVEYREPIVAERVQENGLLLRNLIERLIVSRVLSVHMSDDRDVWLHEECRTPHPAGLEDSNFHDDESVMGSSL